MRLTLALLLAVLPASAVAAEKRIRPAAPVAAQKCTPAAPQVARGARLMRPDQLERPVSLERAVWRRVEGCPVRVIVRDDVDRRTDAPLPRR